MHIRENSAAITAIVNGKIPAPSIAVMHSDNARITGMNINIPQSPLGVPGGVIITPGDPPPAGGGTTTGAGSSGGGPPPPSGGTGVAGITEGGVL